MNRDDVDGLIADVLAEHFARLRSDLEARADRRALPPFAPPAAWSAGRHGASSVVRHRNGLFAARRDTDAEPGTDEAWLPLLVGVASLEFEWDERTLVVRAALSDGAVVEISRELTVPIVRGYWDAEQDYRPGDRVIRFGEWHATQPSKGVDPASADAGGHWLKVSGKQARGPAFTLDDEGTLFEGGRAAGSLKPLIETLLAKYLGGPK